MARANYAKTLLCWSKLSHEYRALESIEEVAPYEQAVALLWQNADASMFYTVTGQLRPISFLMSSTVVHECLDLAGLAFQQHHVYA